MCTENKCGLKNYTHASYLYANKFQVRLAIENHVLPVSPLSPSKAGYIGRLACNA